MLHEDFKLVILAEHRDRLMHEIDDVISFAYKKNIDEQIGGISEGLLRRFVKANRKSELEKKLIELREDLRAMGLVKLTLAYRPGRKDLEEIVRALRKKIGSDVVIEWKVDHRIVGGIAFSFGGRFYDLSYREKIEKYLAK